MNTNTNQKTEYRFGIIGYGNMANYHSKKTFKPECINFCAAYDKNPKRLEVAKRDGLNVYDNLENMFD